LFTFAHLSITIVWVFLAVGMMAWELKWWAYPMIPFDRRGVWKHGRAVAHCTILLAEQAVASSSYWPFISWCLAVLEVVPMVLQPTVHHFAVRSLA